MTHLPARHDGLPVSLIDLAETLGLSVAMKLIQAFGGQEVKFPRQPRPDHPIIIALGERDGHAVCEYLGGAMIYVPHGRAGANRRAVARLETKGHTRGEIARMLGISQRHVRRLANREDDDRQPGLFDD
jgi:Mor family transcriptional regulator